MPKVIYDIYNDDNDPFQVVVDIGRVSDTGTWHTRTQGALTVHRGKVLWQASSHNLTVKDFVLCKSDTNYYGIRLYGAFQFGYFNDDGSGLVINSWGLSFKANYPESRVSWDYAGTL